VEKGNVMPTFRVDVNSEVLVWARNAIGMSVEDAAVKLDITALTLRFWEEGAYSEAQPTLVQLRKMARLYRLPLAALYLDSPPEEEGDKLPDFRLIPAEHSREWSPELHATFRRARMQREVAIELAEAADELPEAISLSLTLTNNPEAAGSKIRKWLDVSVAEQVASTSHYRALNSWIESIERHGILVTQSRGVSLQEMRGLSISDQPFPVIVLNGYDTPRGKTFTLIHELTHILLHSSGLCDLIDTRRVRSIQDETETFCNRVAGALLLPYDQMVEELADLGVEEPIPWPDDVLAHLANRYHVSREVVLRRMVSLGRATIEHYFQKLRQYSQGYEERRERQRKSPGGPDSSVLKLRDLGQRYTSDVLRAYGRRDINAAELSEYLDAKVEQIPKLVSLLERAR
jgi:Zn-dependent peptidase ImmA (M78 family)/DNA-binding XRE family transcriptional regulator